MSYDDRGGMRRRRWRDILINSLFIFTNIKYRYLLGHIQNKNKFETLKEFPFQMRYEDNFPFFFILLLCFSFLVHLYIPFTFLACLYYSFLLLSPTILRLILLRLDKEGKQRNNDKKNEKSSIFT